MAKTIEINDPPIARTFFANTKTAWLWLIIRVYVGWQWLTAGWGKLGSPAWTGEDAGASIIGFSKGAIAKMAGDHPDVQPWYGWFLENVVIENAVLWSYMIVWGEILVGVALIIGLFTGIAAFFGLFMNLNFLLAGTVSSNPVLFVLSIGLVLAWKVAGYWGLDRYVLPALGTPWQPGKLFNHQKGASNGSESPGRRF